MRKDISKIKFSEETMKQIIANQVAVINGKEEDELFAIADARDTKCVYARVYESPNEVFVECDHSLWEHGDIDDRGTCPICGAECDWHYEKDVDDNYPDYIQEIEVSEPHEWHEPDEPQGLIKKIYEEVKNA